MLVAPPEDWSCFIMATCYIDTRLPERDLPRLRQYASFPLYGCSVNPSCFSPDVGDAFRRVRQAAARGHHGCVSRLCRNAEIVDVQLCTTAVTQGDSWFLQWLLSNFELVTGSNLAHSDHAGLLLRLAHHAATHGQLACLKQVMETLAAIGARLYETPLAAYAARGGHVTCLRYMCIDHHLALTGVVAAAARGGHFQCLQFAYERGAEWEMDTTAHLAFGGHVRCLRYARERGAPLWYKASDEAQGEADGKVLVRVFPTKASLLRSPSTARRLGLAMQPGEGQQSITCDLNDSWLALAYAQAQGAPLGRITGQFVAERRAAAAAFFRCFAGQNARGILPGPPGPHAKLHRLMRDVKGDVVRLIAEKAGLWCPELSAEYDCVTGREVGDNGKGCANGGGRG